MQRRKKSLFYRLASCCVMMAFIFTSVMPANLSYAQTLNLPLPGTLITPTAGFQPALIKGVNLNADNPLQFDFIIDQGDETLSSEAFKDESTKLVKYFLAALTIPEEEMWVNLSPYEENRIIPDEFGKTEMGRDLLAQDYMLKQLTASLMYPDNELGAEFWQRVRQKAKLQFGTDEIPMNTFNKIWIVPQAAEVYEHAKGAFVVDSYLKVMLEEDYVALEANKNSISHGLGNIKEGDLNIITGVSAQVVKEILIPEIEKEVNQGRIFANLRQVYNSVILASWYKQSLKDSLLGQIYVDQHKTVGVEQTDVSENQKIYDRYVEAFKQGVYDIIKEEYDPTAQQVSQKKYFSGGASLAMVTETSRIVDVGANLARAIENTPAAAMTTFEMQVKSSDAALSSAPVKLNALGEEVLYDKKTEKERFKFPVTRPGTFIIRTYGEEMGRRSVLNETEEIRITSSTPPFKGRMQRTLEGVRYEYKVEKGRKLLIVTRNSYDVERFSVTFVPLSKKDDKAMAAGEVDEDVYKTVVALIEIGSKGSDPTIHTQSLIQYMKSTFRTKLEMVVENSVLAALNNASAIGEDRKLISKEDGNYDYYTSAAMSASSEDLPPIDWELQDMALYEPTSVVVGAGEGQRKVPLTAAQNSMYQLGEYVKSVVIIPDEFRNAEATADSVDHWVALHKHSSGAWTFTIHYFDPENKPEPKKERIKVQQLNLETGELDIVEKEVLIASDQRAEAEVVINLGITGADDVFGTFLQKSMGIQQNVIPLVDEHGPNLGKKAARVQEIASLLGQEIRGIYEFQKNSRGFSPPSDAMTVVIGTWTQARPTDWEKMERIRGPHTPVTFTKNSKQTKFITSIRYSEEDALTYLTLDVESVEGEAKTRSYQLPINAPALEVAKGYDFLQGFSNLRGGRFNTDELLFDQMRVLLEARLSQPVWESKPSDGLENTSALLDLEAGGGSVLVPVLSREQFLAGEFSSLAKRRGQLGDVSQKRIFSTVTGFKQGVHVEIHAVKVKGRNDKILVVVQDTSAAMATPYTTTLDFIRLASKNLTIREEALISEFVGLFGNLSHESITKDVQAALDNAFRRGALRRQSEGVYIKIHDADFVADIKGTLNKKDNNQKKVKFEKGFKADLIITRGATEIPVKVEYKKLPHQPTVWEILVDETVRHQLPGSLYIEANGFRLSFGSGVEFSIIGNTQGELIITNTSRQIPDQPDPNNIIPIRYEMTEPEPAAAAMTTDTKRRAVHTGESVISFAFRVKFDAQVVWDLNADLLKKKGVRNKSTPLTPKGIGSLVTPLKASEREALRVAVVGDSLPQIESRSPSAETGEAVSARGNDWAMTGDTGDAASERERLNNRFNLLKRVRNWTTAALGIWTFIKLLQFTEFARKYEEQHKLERGEESYSGDLGEIITAAGFPVLWTAITVGIVAVWGITSSVAKKRAKANLQADDVDLRKDAIRYYLKKHITEHSKEFSRMVRYSHVIDRAIDDLQDPKMTRLLFIYFAEFIHAFGEGEEARLDEQKWAKFLASYEAASSHKEKKELFIKTVAVADKKILLVAPSNASNKNGVKNRLEQFGHTVVVVESKEDALAKLSDKESGFDVILADTTITMQSTADHPQGEDTDGFIEGVQGKIQEGGKLVFYTSFDDDWAFEFSLRNGNVKVIGNTNLYRIAEVVSPAGEQATSSAMVFNMVAREIVSHGSVKVPGVQLRKDQVEDFQSEILTEEFGRSVLGQMGTLPEHNDVKARFDVNPGDNGYISWYLPMPVDIQGRDFTLVEVRLSVVNDELLIEIISSEESTPSAFEHFNGSAFNTLARILTVELQAELDLSVPLSVIIGGALMSFNEAHYLPVGAVVERVVERANVSEEVVRMYLNGLDEGGYLTFHDTEGFIWDPSEVNDGFWEILEIQDLDSPYTITLDFIRLASKDSTINEKGLIDAMAALFSHLSRDVIREDVQTALDNAFRRGALREESKGVYTKVYDADGGPSAATVELLQARMGSSPTKKTVTDNIVYTETVAQIEIASKGTIINANTLITAMKARFAKEAGQDVEQAVLAALENATKRGGGKKLVKKEDGVYEKRATAATKSGGSDDRFIRGVVWILGSVVSVAFLVAGLLSLFGPESIRSTESGKEFVQAATVVAGLLSVFFPIMLYRHLRKGKQDKGVVTSMPHVEEATEESVVEIAPTAPAADELITVDEVVDKINALIRGGKFRDMGGITIVDLEGNIIYETTVGQYRVNTAKEKLVEHFGLKSSDQGELFVGDIQEGGIVSVSGDVMTMEIPEHKLEVLRDPGVLQGWISEKLEGAGTELKNPLQPDISEGRLEIINAVILAGLQLTERESKPAIVYDKVMIAVKEWTAGKKETIAWFEYFDQRIAEMFLSASDPDHWVPEEAKQLTGLEEIQGDLVKDRVEEIEDAIAELMGEAYSSVTIEARGPRKEVQIEKLEMPDHTDALSIDAGRDTTVGALVDKLNEYFRDGDPSAAMAKTLSTLDMKDRIDEVIRQVMPPEEARDIPEYPAGSPLLASLVSDSGDTELVGYPVQSLLLAPLVSKPYAAGFVSVSPLGRKKKKAVYKVEAKAEMADKIREQLENIRKAFGKKAEILEFNDGSKSGVLSFQLLVVDKAMAEGSVEGVFKELREVWESYIKELGLDAPSIQDGRTTRRIDVDGKDAFFFYSTKNGIAGRVTIKVVDATQLEYSVKSIAVENSDGKLAYNGAADTIAVKMRAMLDGIKAKYDESQPEEEAADVDPDPENQAMTTRIASLVFTFMLAIPGLLEAKVDPEEFNKAIDELVVKDIQKSLGVRSTLQDDQMPKLNALDADKFREQYLFDVAKMKEVLKGKKALGIYSAINSSIPTGFAQSQSYASQRLKFITKWELLRLVVEAGAGDIKEKTFYEDFAKDLIKDLNRQGAPDKMNEYVAYLGRFFDWDKVSGPLLEALKDKQNPVDGVKWAARIAAEVTWSKGEKAKAQFAETLKELGEWQGYEARRFVKGKTDDQAMTGESQNNRERIFSMRREGSVLAMFQEQLRNVEADMAAIEERVNADGLTIDGLDGDDQRRIRYEEYERQAEEISAQIEQGNFEGVEGILLERDAEEGGDEDEAQTVGGIDMNPAMINMKVDGQGVAVPATPESLRNLNIDGLVPVLINVQPITNLPLLLGLADTPQDEPVDVGQDLEPADKRKVFEQVSI